MIKIDIPGYKKIEAGHLILDFNGTLATDGKLIPGTLQLLEKLSGRLDIHIITADTFGTSGKELKGINCKHKIINPLMQDIQKEMYVVNLGSAHVIAIGNGQNDLLMFRRSALSIMVIQREGAFGKLMPFSDIVCFSINDALELLLNPIRIVATLRK